jgi:hypothetical protein
MKMLVLNSDQVSPDQGRILSRRVLLKILPAAYVGSSFAQDVRYFARMHAPKVFSGVPAQRGGNSKQAIPGDLGSGPMLKLPPDSVKCLIENADKDGNWWSPPQTDLSDFGSNLSAFVGNNEHHNVIPALASLGARGFKCSVELLERAAGRAIAEEILGPLAAAALIADLVLLSREIYVTAKDYVNGVFTAKDMVGRIGADKKAYIVRSYRFGKQESGRQTITETAYFQNSWAPHGDRIWECTYQEAV